MNKLIFCSVVSVLFFAVFLVTEKVGCAGGSWPEIKECKVDYNFSDASNAHVDIGIFSTDGEKVYDFQCHPGDYPNDPLFDYSGFFHCRLISLYSKEELGSLLTDSLEETKEWENRGRFLVDHVIPGHADYVDWGRERHFRLRGIEIILKIYDETFKRKSDGSIDNVKAFSFNVNIKNRPSSDGEISEPPDNQRPKWFYGVAVP